MISSSQVKIEKLSKYNNATLDTYIDHQRTYWLRDFVDYNSEYQFSVAIERAMDFLNSVDSGVVNAPETCIDNKTLLRYPTKLLKLVGKINVEYHNNRYPINSESRPLLGTEFEVGDRVINTDISANKCVGWICIEGGIPGVWREYGQIRRHYTEVQSLNYLPQASELQLGRQVLLTRNNVSSLWICKITESGYKWFQQDYEIGDTNSRPTDPYIGYMRYNTEYHSIEWWTGYDWSRVPTSDDLSIFTTEVDVLSMIRKFSLPSDLGSIVQDEVELPDDNLDIGGGGY